MSSTYLQSIVEMSYLSSICLLRSNTSSACSFRDFRMPSALCANAAATGAMFTLRRAFAFSFASSSRIDDKPNRDDELLRRGVSSGVAVIFLFQKKNGKNPNKFLVEILLVTLSPPHTQTFLFPRGRHFWRHISNIPNHSIVFLVDEVFDCGPNATI